MLCEVHINGGVFAFIYDCFCDPGFIYGKTNDKLQFIISKEL